MSVTPCLCHEVVAVHYSNTPTKLSPKQNISHIYCIESSPPLEFALTAFGQVVGHSEQGKLQCTKSNGHLNYVGKSLIDAGQHRNLSHALAKLGVDECGLRLADDASIQLLDPDICANDQPIQLLLSYYNIWSEHKQYPFGKIGRWLF